jgi:hypothetical protein
MGNIRWARDASHMEEKRNVYNILVGRLEGTRT